MIRLRRVPPRGLFRRKRYEIQFEAPSGDAEAWSKFSTAPVVDIDPYLGVGDAWVLVHAADDAWNGESGEWVTLQADA